MAPKPDDETVLPAHGGDLHWAARHFDIPIAEWVDLSTGLNPWSYPLTPADPSDWARLPTADREQALIDAARTFYGAGLEAGLVAAPGTQALIQWLPRIVPASTVTVVAPTYSEHATAWFRAGHEVIEAPDLDAASPASTIIVVVNPNNPDGRVWARDDLLRTAWLLAERGGFMVVDEAFGDLEPGFSLADQAGRPGLVILKSFGKFFGLAGLRLGFALGPKSMQQALVESLGPWPVATPALEAGIQALSDQDWAAETRVRLSEGRRRLDGAIADAGLAIKGGTDLYRLIEDDRARALFDHLARHGILTRVFAYEPTWLRLGLPAEAAALERLAKALADF